MNTITAPTLGGDSTYYHAHWGKPLIVISAFALLLCLGLPLYLTTILKLPAHGWELILGSIVLPIFIPLAALPFVVKGYTITRHNVRIHRLWWDTVIPSKTIVSVKVHPNAMGKSIRTFGNGGLFSFTGRYWCKSLGHYKAYVTDFNKTVVIKTDSGTSVISPADPDAFAAEFHAH